MSSQLSIVNDCSHSQLSLNGVFLAGPLYTSKLSLEAYSSRVTAFTWVELIHRPKVDVHNNVLVDAPRGCRQQISEPTAGAKARTESSANQARDQHPHAGAISGTHQRCGFPQSQCVMLAHVFQHTASTKRLLFTTLQPLSPTLPKAQWAQSSPLLIRQKY